MNTFNISPLMRNSIGFDSLDHFFDETINRNDISGSFPHYNIVKSSENSYKITLALAGYSKDNIEIIHKNNNLTISGKIEEEKVDFLHRGIAARKFERSFDLAEYMDVSSAKMSNGLLILELDRNIPEEFQPKKISIN